jgi:hypothetical protein
MSSKKKKRSLREDLEAIVNYCQTDDEWDSFAETEGLDDKTYDDNDPKLRKALASSDHVYAVAQRLREALDDGRLFHAPNTLEKLPSLKRLLDVTPGQSKLIEVVYGDHSLPFMNDAMFDDNLRDALKWFTDDKINTIVDDSAGGIIAYAHEDHAARIARLLNAAVCSQKHQL